MTALSDALEGRRQALVAALYSQPLVRAAGLGTAELTSVVDVAMAEAAIPELLSAVMAGQAAVAALAGEVASPPPEVTAVVDAWEAERSTVGERYNLA